MKKTILSILLTISIFMLSSCKKCKACQCWKDGVQYEETNCAYGFPPNTQTLNVWESYLKEEIGYDTVICD